MRAAGDTHPTAAGAERSRRAVGGATPGRRRQRGGRKRPEAAGALAATNEQFFSQVPRGSHHATN